MTVDELLRRYAVKFMADLQNLQAAGGGMNNFWTTVEDDTNFGKLLHKEGLWSLYQYKEEKSLLYHLCRDTYGRMGLVNNACESITSRCCRCERVAPDEIKGIWTLHNFDWVQENGGRDV